MVPPPGAITRDQLRALAFPPRQDSIVNFGEDLPASQIDGGFAAARKADLCLALGSSLTVTPAADIPSTVGTRWAMGRGESLVSVTMRQHGWDAQGCREAMLR